MLSALPEAAKEKKLLPWCADPAWETSCVGENSRQGFRVLDSTLRQGSSEVKTSITLGIAGTLYDGGIRSRCTGKERDDETGLDYFGARYYANALGRWLSPDWAAKPVAVPYAVLSDPQTLNLYQFVGGNPASKADVDGHIAEKKEIPLPPPSAPHQEPPPLVQKILNLVDGKGWNTNREVAAKDAQGRADWAQKYPHLSPPPPPAVGMAPMLTPGGSPASAASKTALADDALVVRGGLNQAENFVKGTGVTVDGAGNLQGVSVNSANGASVAELSQGVKNGQVGVSTVGDVRAAGGTVTPSPTVSNPNHCTMCGITPQKAQELFTPTIPNPSKP